MPSPRTTKQDAPAAGEAPTEAQLTAYERLAETVKGKGLHAKIALIQTHVGAVEKTGTVAFKGIKFSHMQEHGLIQEIRALQRACGLSVIPGCMGEGSWSRDGNAFFIDLALTVTDSESGESITRWYPNVGVDTADKGFNKAFTGATKYALQKFFLVPTDAIDDNETVELQASAQSTAGNGRPESPPARAKSLNAASAAAVADLRKTLLEAHNDGSIPSSQTGNYIVTHFGKSSLDELTAQEVADMAGWAVQRMADHDAAQQS